MHIGFAEQYEKLEFAEGNQGIEQHCHSEPVRTTFVGISIEFRTAYRHTDRSLHHIPGSIGVLSGNGTSVREIATPVCARLSNG